MVVNDQPFPLGHLAMEPYEAVPAEVARQIERELAEAMRVVRETERVGGKALAALSADGRSVGNSEQVQKDWNNAAGQLDAIAKVLGYPVESWRIAGCDFLAHAVRGLQDAYIGLKGSTDALLRDADAKLSVAQSSVRATLPEAACKAIVHDMRPSDEAVQIAEGKGKLKLGESYSKLCDEILRLAKEVPASATRRSFCVNCMCPACVSLSQPEHRDA
jgi:hypothetical protein